MVDLTGGESHGIEIGIDSRPAEAGKQRVVRNLDEIKKKTESLGPSTEKASQGYRAWSQRMDQVGQRVGRTMDQIRKKTNETGRAGSTAADRLTASISKITGAGSGFRDWSRSIDQVGGSVDRVVGKAKNAAGSFREWSRQVDALAASMNKVASKNLGSQRSFSPQAAGMARGGTADDRLAAAIARATKEQNRFEAQTDRARVRMDDLRKSANAFTGRNFDQASSAAGGLFNRLTSIRNLIVTLGAYEIGKNIIQTDQAFRGFNQSLKIVTGSQAGANQQMQFVEKTAQSLGLRVKDLAASWVGMAAASRGTVMEGRRTEEVFTAITKAGVAYGLSNDNIRGSLLAVQQMMNKGQVQAEELRGQLGERLPGAFQIAARSMGKTTSELSKMLELGQVVSADFLPKFAAQLQKELPDGLKSVNAGFNAFLDAWDEASIALSRSGLFDGVAAGATSLAQALKRMAEDGSLAAFGKTLGGVLTALADNIELLKLAGIAYGAYFATIKVAVIIQYVSQLVALERALGAATTAQALFGVGLKGLQALIMMVTSTIGLATIAITALIGIFLALQSHGSRTQAVLEGMDKSLKDATNGLATAGTQAKVAGSGVAGFGGEAAGAVGSVNSFAGAVGNAAQQLYELARARQKAALSEVMEKRAKVQADTDMLRGETRAGTTSRDQAANRNIWETAKTSPMKLPGAIWRGMKEQTSTTAADLSRELGFGPDEQQLQAGIQKGKAALSAYDKQIVTLKGNLEQFIDDQERSSAAAGAAMKPSLAMANALAKQEAATTELQKAQAGLAVTKVQAAADLKAGLITEAQYASRVGDSIKAVNNARAAASGHKKALSEQKKMMDEASRSASKLDTILMRWDDQPKFLDGAAKDMAALDDMVGKWIEVGDAVVRYTEEMKKADVAKIAQGMKKPFEDLIKSSKEELAVSTLRLQGREIEAEALSRRYSYEQQFGKMTSDQFKQVMAQVAAHKLVNDELEKRQRITEIYVGVVDDIQQAFEKMLGTFAKDPLKSVKNFFKDVVGSFKTMFSRLMSESIFGGLQQEIRDLVNGNNGVKDASAVLVDELTQTKTSVTALSDAMIEAAQIIKDAATEASNVLTPKAANDNSVVDAVSDIVVTARKNDPAGPKSARSTSDQVMDRVIGRVLGKTGSALKGLWNMMPKGMQQTLGKVGDTITTGLGKLGIKLPKGLENISSSVTNALKGAGEGMMASSLVKSLGIKQSSTGAGIGGAIGSALPIPGGSIIGGLVGGTLGGLLKKTKWGAANVTNTTDAATMSGNSKSAKANAATAASSIQSGLTSIAEQLGGMATGAFNVTIGQRHGDWRVREGTGSLKVKKGATEFDDDAEGALAYAIQLAVKQGAIQGISEASKRVLTSASDTDSAVSAATTYEDLLRQLAKMKDPIKGTFQEIERNITNTTNALKAAGYSAADLAAVEEVFNQQRKDALENLTSGYKSFLEEITNGPDSGKTIWQQFQDAQSKFASVKAGVANGTATQEDFTNAGQNLFDLARQVYGSATPEFEAIKANLVSATQDALTQVQQASGLSAADIAGVSTAIEASAAAAEAQRDEQTQYLADIAQSLKDLKANDNSGNAGYYAGSGSGRSGIDGRYTQAY